MKKAFQLMFLIMGLALNGCKDPEPRTEIDHSTTEIEVSEKETKKEESPQETKKPPPPNHHEYLFVSKKTGIGYAAEPKAEVQGRFPLNTSLKVVEYPKIYSEINKGGEILKAEWLGVEKDSDTVYVPNAFLSHFYTYSEIILYTASPYYKERDGEIRTAFVNLSEAPYYLHVEQNNNNEESILGLSEDDMQSDTISLSSRQRKAYFKAINVSESDKVFIYELKNDSVHTYDVKNLPLIACINIYSSGGNYGIGEDDYEVGFDLGKSFNGSYENFVYVGKENPFQKGELKPMIWEEIDNENFPAVVDESMNTTKKETLIYSLNNLDYFLQRPVENGGSYHLVVVDKNKNSVVYDQIFHESEGTILRTVNIKNQEPLFLDQGQWTGELFKNKPAIIFGFLGYSFGCPIIEFLEETEPPIPILCDNRH